MGWTIIGPSCTHARNRVGARLVFDCGMRSRPLDNAGPTAYHSPRVPRREWTMGKEIDLLRGTLDMLILKAVSLGPQHGYGVLLRIQQLAKGNLQIEQGSLYPALYRLEHKGFIEAEWGESENNRKAKFYRLTSAGRRQLRLETESWKRLGKTITAVLNAVPE